MCDEFDFNSKNLQRSLIQICGTKLGKKFFINLIFQIEDVTFKLFLKDIPLVFDGNILYNTEQLIFESKTTKKKQLGEIVEKMKLCVLDKNTKELKQLVGTKLNSKVLTYSDKFEEILLNLGSLFVDLEKSKLKNHYKERCDVCFNEKVVALKCCFCDYHLCGYCRIEAFSNNNNNQCWKCRNTYGN